MGVRDAMTPEIVHCFKERRALQDAAMLMVGSTDPSAGGFEL